MVPGGMRCRLPNSLLPYFDRSPRSTDHPILLGLLGHAKLCYKPRMRNWVRERMRRRGKKTKNESESTGKVGQEKPPTTAEQPAPLQPSYYGGETEAVPGSEPSAPLAQPEKRPRGGERHETKTNDRRCRHSPGPAPAAPALAATPLSQPRKTRESVRLPIARGTKRI